MNATATSAPAGPQHMRALARANQIRLARAELKRGVAAGKVDVAEVIVHCPWEAHSMAVSDLLMSQRRWGQTRCRKFLARLPMSEQKTVGSMTDRQRHVLAVRAVEATSSRCRRTGDGMHKLRDSLSVRRCPVRGSHLAVRRPSRASPAGTGLP